MNKLNRLYNMEHIRLTQEFIFLNPYRFVVYFIYSILGLLVGVCVFLSFTNKQETIDVQGSLQRTDKVQDVQILVDGVVDGVYVEDGGYVEEGETILSLQSSKLDVQKEDLQKKLEEAQKQQELVTRLETCIRNGSNTFQDNGEEGQFYAQMEQYLAQIKALESSASQGTITALSQQKAKYQELLQAMQDDGSLPEDHAYATQWKIYQNQVETYQRNIAQLETLVSQAVDPLVKEQYQQQLDTYKAELQTYMEQQQLSVQQQIDTLDQQLIQAQNSASDAQKSAQSEIEKLKTTALLEAKNAWQELQTQIEDYTTSLASMDADLSYYSVKASESGYVYYKVDVKKGLALTGGSSVGILTAGETTSDAFQVLLNVPSSGIGFVKQGQQVKLTVDGLDSRDYGYLMGEVQKIYEIPVQTDSGVYYVVETSVDLSENQGIYREVFRLKNDMSVQANIETKETSWMVYLLQKINVFKDEEPTGQ